MNFKLSIGSVVYGAAGIGCKLLSIDGDTLTVETPNGTRKIAASKVVRVEPPPLLAGQRVRFMGDTVLFRELNQGEILEVVEDCGEWVKTRTAKRKPVSVLRSDLELGDSPEYLGDTDLKESQPSPSLTLFNVGDRVRYVGEVWGQFLGQSIGIITDTNHLTLTDSPDRFEVDWGDDWAGCRWFEELDLEAIL
jgi:hypothetical protein